MERGSPILDEQRTSYDVDPENGKFTEEVAKVFGVPFEVIPFKATKGVAPPVKRYHVHALPNRAHLEIKFPRVEGYTQAIRNRITVDWETIPPLALEPGRIPPEVEVKGLHLSETGRLTLAGPGRVDEVNLQEFRAKRRLQELVFGMGGALTKEFRSRSGCTIPTHVLFPQAADVVRRFVEEKVRVSPPANVKDLFLAPYYGWLIERLLEAIRPDTGEGETPEVPRYEVSRGPGSTSEVDFWTSREVREVTKSHLNYMVADTKRWEQSAAYFIDRHPAVRAFVKNAGLGFAIPYLHNGQMHDYMPDFIIRFQGATERFLILEIKGYDPIEDVKGAAAERWISAVNVEGSYGKWVYALVRQPTEVRRVLDQT